MDMILAVFRSRAQTLDFVARLKRMGASASAVSTPKEGEKKTMSSANSGAAINIIHFFLSFIIFTTD